MEFLAQNIPVIVVFHAYAQKPCADGLVAAALYCRLAKVRGHFVKQLVPHWHSLDSVETLRRALEGLDAVQVVYIDIIPYLEEERDLLNRQGIRLTVLDHHSVKDFEISTWLRQHCVELLLDETRCATRIVADLLALQLGHVLDDCTMVVVSLIQFSEYEGVSKELSGAMDLEISLGKAVESNKDCQDLVELQLLRYFVVDKILPTRNEWQFLYKVEHICGSAQQEMLHDKINSFTRRCMDAVLGHSNFFLLDDIMQFLYLRSEAAERLSKESHVTLIHAMKEKVDSTAVLVIKMDIMRYGRTLEQLVRNAMSARGAKYALLVNPPRKCPDESISYYLSIRPSAEEGVAADATWLCSRLKELSGSKIGGGHSWASAVTLNEAQYKTVAVALDLYEYLITY